MKHHIRVLVGLSLAAPIAWATLVVSIFTGREKAVTILGPKVTLLAKSLQRYFPPAVKHAGEFDLFKSKLKGKQKLWQLLYDYPIEFPDEETARLEVRNCPFAEALAMLNIPEFGHYMCQGDWEVAKENADKWCFERSCTIGTGGEICDFTYKQITHEN